MLIPIVSAFCLSGTGFFSPDLVPPPHPLTQSPQAPKRPRKESVDAGLQGTNLERWNQIVEAIGSHRSEVIRSGSDKLPVPYRYYARAAADLMQVEERWANLLDRHRAHEALASAFHHLLCGWTSDTSYSVWSTEVRRPELATLAYFESVRSRIDALHVKPSVWIMFDDPVATLAMGEWLLADELYGQRFAVPVFRVALADREKPTLEQLFRWNEILWLNALKHPGSNSLARSFVELAEREQPQSPAIAGKAYYLAGLSLMMDVEYPQSSLDKPPSWPMTDPGGRRMHQAEVHFRKALSFEPTNTDILVEVCRSLALRGETQLAAKTLGTRQPSTDVMAMVHFGEVGFMIGEGARTLQTLTDIAAALDEKGKKRLWLSLAARLNHFRQAESASLVLGIAARNLPEDHDVAVRCGIALRVVGKPNEAVECLQKATRMPGATAETHVFLADALAVLGRHEDALARYADAIALDSQCPEAWRGYRLVLSDVHHDKGAEPVVQRIQKLCGAKLDACWAANCEIGYVLALAGDMPRASQAFASAYRACGALAGGDRQKLESLGEGVYRQLAGLTGLPAARWDMLVTEILAVAPELSKLAQLRNSRAYHEELARAQDGQLFESRRLERLFVSENTAVSPGQTMPSRGGNYAASNAVRKWRMAKASDAAAMGIPGWRWAR